MNYFENVYANFISVNLITNNLNFNRSYTDFLKEYHPLAYNDLENNQNFSKIYEPVQCEEIEYNQEVIDSMVSLLHYTSSNFTTLNKRDIFFDLLKLEKDNMFHYIWKILNIMQCYINQEKDELLPPYLLPDGVLKKIEYKHDICNLYLHGVLDYTYEDVTTKNIIMKFEHVDNVTFKGSLYLNDLSHSRVYETISYKTSKECYCYDILCIDNYELLIITITYKNIKIIEIDD